MMERRREINADQNQKKKVFIHFRDRNFFTKRKNDHEVSKDHRKEKLESK